ncbi:MAG: hypothetical protein US16_C0003G0061 [Candidatus Moranbacteria bacterium GW2011_GWE2_36_40]|nr:MAG: hypothetical protein US16_C0003G0061 [Candidatus Moranbacteria bacterium GW2011_GWE2_36_40]
MPPSVATRMILREEEESSKKPTPGFSDFVRNKHDDSPNLSNLPKDPAKARAYACSELKPKPNPPPEYNF